jgi:CheY-like chemotaxis protein
VASPNALARGLCDDQEVRPTVLIVDDHEAFRESASALLGAEGFAVVGEAADGGAAIAACERLRPDVVLLDIQLPDVDGFTVAERLAAVREPPTVVLISSREAEAYGPRRAGGRGRRIRRRDRDSGLAERDDDARAGLAAGGRRRP